MLDFQVDVALGDEELTAAELRELMAADDGLVLLRGQWVEVDREHLQEALEHWKQVEASAADGVSFVEGMRLLAGAPQDLADDDRSRRAPRLVVRPGWRLAGQAARRLARPEATRQRPVPVRR